MPTAVPEFQAVRNSGTGMCINAAETGTACSFAACSRSQLTTSGATQPLHDHQTVNPGLHQMNRGLPDPASLQNNSTKHPQPLCTRTVRCRPDCKASTRITFETTAPVIQCGAVTQNEFHICRLCSSQAGYGRGSIDSQEREQIRGLNTPASDPRAAP